MRKRHRQLWTLALTLSAVALIVTVVVVAGFRVLVKAVPGYRDDIEQRVSETLDRRVTIRELDLRWRRFRPSLDLIEVTLFGDDGSTPALKLRELNIGIDWLALLTARLRISELRLVGIALTVERMADGDLRVSGISSDKPLTTTELRRIAEAAKRVGRLVVADSQLLWLDYTDPNTFHRIGEINLTLSSRGSRHQLQANALLPVNYGGSVKMHARARGELAAFDQLMIDADLQAQNLQAGTWLQPWLRKDFVLEGNHAQLRLVTQWRGRVLQSASGDVTSGALNLRQAGRSRMFVDDLQSEFKISAIDDGWQLVLERLSLKAPARQPAMASGTFDLHLATDAQPLSLAGKLDQLRLDEPGQWLALFDWGGQAWLAGLQPVGHVQDLRFQYQAAMPAVDDHAGKASRYALQCRFQDLGFSPEKDRPGVTGMDGRLKLDQSGGELMLMVNNGQLLAPQTFDQPVPLPLVSGTLNWQRVESDWLLSTKALRWQGPADLAGSTDMELKLFGAGGKPHMVLDTQFAADSWADVRAFFPRVPVIDENARQWIQTAIVDGNVTKGHVQIRGLLHHFPYHSPEEPGLFRIDFDVSDGVIDYAEGWPAIDRINAHLVFQGRTMQIDAESGRILGTPVGPVWVEVKDFKEPLLEVDGDVAADAGKMLSFLSESPLRTDYAGLAQALKLKGPARLDLQLEIPLDQIEDTRVFGVVTLDGKTQLNHAKLPEPITDINGQVQFSNSGLMARDLTGELMGLKLSLQLDPEQQEGKHLTRLQAVTEIAFPRDATRLAKLASADMLARLHGSTQWRADMLFDASATPAQLQLNSDLTGLSVTLPPPFAKSASDALPVSISLDPSAAASLRTNISYGNLLDAALQLRDNEGRWMLERGHVVLGEGSAQLPQQPGLWLDGQLSELDLELWRSVLTPPPPPASTGTPGQQPKSPAEPAMPLLQRADLRIGRLLAADQVFEKLQLQLTRDTGDWLLTTGGPSVEGTLRWPRQPAGRAIYQADLQRLKLSASQAGDQDMDATALESDDDAPPRDPAALPGLSLRCRNLQVNEHALGALQIEAVPVPDGLALSTLSLNGDLDVQGSGSWTRSGGESSAQLSLSAKGSKLKQMFAALGYEPSLEAEKVRLQASLAWSPNAEGIKTEMLGGGFSLDLEKGVLLTVEPGAGRVLGLLNFTALPRRLTLDFRDVVSKGLAFDTLKGDFRIEQGNAWTDNLKIRGPSLKMEIEGRVGLAARDYDQKITIHPQVSEGVALAGTLAGGPAVGLGLLLAQRLFKKPLEEMSELSYRLRGSWDNPTIDKDE